MLYNHNLYLLKHFITPCTIKQLFPTLPSPRPATPNTHSSVCIDLFWKLHINRIIQYMNFWVTASILLAWFQRFIYSVPWIGTSISFSWLNTVTAHIHTTVGLIHSPTDGHLGSFPLSGRCEQHCYEHACYMKTHMLRKSKEFSLDKLSLSCLWVVVITFCHYLFTSLCLY